MARSATGLPRGREDPRLDDLREIAADAMAERVLRQPPRWRRCRFVDLGAGRLTGKRTAQFRVAQDENQTSRGDG